MTAPPTRVVKMGGSLFLYEDLPRALSRWLEIQSPAVHVCIAGGGHLADGIRHVDLLHDIGDEFGHWLCVRLLETTGELLARLLPDARRIVTWHALQEAILEVRPGQAIVFTPEEFLRVHEPHLPGPSLSRDWRTSSDSIAARIASALNAAELVLMKSCPPPDILNWNSAAAAGLVDSEFPATAAGLAVRWVNLREAN